MAAQLICPAGTSAGHLDPYGHRRRRSDHAGSPVAGFDETTLRSGPAGEKKYVHGAFTERYSAFWLSTRNLEAMEDAGILPGSAG